MNKWKPILYSLPFLFVLIGFQNCSMVNSKVGFSQRTAKGGSGDTYDGKPGTYYRVIPGYDCNGQQFVVSEIEKSANGELLHRSLNANCEALETSLAPSEVEIATAAPDLIGFQEGVFQRFPQTPIQAQMPELTEAWCRVDEQNEIVVSTEVSSLASHAYLYTTSAGAPRQISVSGRTLASGKVEYVSPGFRLTVAAQFTNGPTAGVVVENNQSRPVSCRLSSYLDAQAPENAAAVAFNVLGVSGGADGNADHFLTTWTAPVIEFEALPSAYSYDVSITNSARTNTVCGPVTVFTTKATLAGCSLTPNTDYNVQVTAKSIYGPIVGAANPFNLTVVGISTERIVVSPNPVQAGQPLRFEVTMTAAQAQSGRLVHFQIWDQNWRFVREELLQNQSFSANSPQTFTLVTTANLAPGLYFVGTMASPYGQATNLTGELTSVPFTINP